MHDIQTMSLSCNEASGVFTKDVSYFRYLRTIEKYDLKKTKDFYKLEERMIKKKTKGAEIRVSAKYKKDKERFLSA